MDNSRFKALLVRDSEWLESLYSANSNPHRRQLISTASDKKIDTLIRFLHLLSTGDIKMHKKNFDALSKRHVQFLKKEFEKKAAFKRLINSDRIIKVQKLLKLLQVFPFLLYTLFNDEAD